MGNYMMANALVLVFIAGRCRCREKIEIGDVISMVRTNITIIAITAYHSCNKPSNCLKVFVLNVICYL